ncbi:MAG: hypothetical protein HDT37_10255 [Clostridiales bacterium]|nr:hypothetical protein [Clostridiales bacterium]
MVKICPTCKKFVPLSATACPMCGNKKLVVANAPMPSPAQVPAPTVTKTPKKKKSKAPIIAISLLALVIIISIPIAVIFLNPCRNGHTWKQATCIAPLTCSVCGETSGEKLGHKWTGATCSEPAVCSRCGEKSYSEMKDHKYNTTGICSVCNATKEYGNSYCYVSKSELYAMAKDAFAMFKLL